MSPYIYPIAPSKMAPLGFPIEHKEKKYPSEEAPRIWVRLEPKIASKFKESCKQNERSQSAEINFILKKYYNV